MKHFLFAVALLCAAPAQAQVAQEWVAQRAQPDLVVAHEQRANGSTIVERIPRGETLERWSRMVTNQRFAGLMARGGGGVLDEWLNNFTGGLANACPGSSTAGLQRLTVSSRPAVQLRANCPRNPTTGQPETIFLIAIAGRADLHVAQVAYRRVPSAADIAYARVQLASVTYCQRTNASTVCTAAARTPEAR